MSFDVQEFMRARFRPRVAEVNVPALKEFFGPAADPVFKVRGLTGQELGRAKAEAAARRDIGPMIESLLAGKPEEQVAALKSIFGFGDAVPQDVAQRIAFLVAGAINPVVDLDFAVKLCTAFPIEFSIITQKILELTGAGHEVGKVPASGATPASEAV